MYTHSTYSHTLIIYHQGDKQPDSISINTAKSNLR